MPTSMVCPERNYTSLCVYVLSTCSHIWNWLFHLYTKSGTFSYLIVYVGQKICLNWPMDIASFILQESTLGYRFSRWDEHRSRATQEPEKYTTTGRLWLGNQIRGRRRLGRLAYSARPLSGSEVILGNGWQMPAEIWNFGVPVRLLFPKTTVYTNVRFRCGIWLKAKSYSSISMTNKVITMQNYILLR